MNPARPHIAVIGAGPMGLACAYELQKQGARVTVLEAGPVPGGMSASFDFAGLPIERYFHFLCRGDHDYVALLDELGLADKLHWRHTGMGFYHQGHLRPWGTALSLLRFPGLSLLDKFRYGLHVLRTRSRDSFLDLEYRRADEWLTAWLGQRGYETLWKPLLSLKFYQHHDNLSAAWIAARIQRLGKSRDNRLREVLGYVEGCTQIVIDALVASIQQGGGDIRLHSPVRRVNSQDGRVQSVETDAGTLTVDAVISTVPLPLIPDMVPDLPEAAKDNIRRMDNIGVATMIFRLKEALTPYFWNNINDPAIPIPGFIEYSNLNPLNGEHIIYVPYYLPQNHEKYGWSQQQFLDELLPIFQRINPRFSPDWVLHSALSRYHYAQPICTPGFGDRIPAAGGSIEGFWMADTTFYYPQDRCVNDSVRVGRWLAQQALNAC